MLRTCAGRRRCLGAETFIAKRMPGGVRRDRDSHGGNTFLGFLPVDRVPVPSDLFQLGFELGPRADGLWSHLFQFLGRVQLMQFVEGKFRQHGLPGGRAVRRHDLAQPGRNSDCRWALQGGDEAHGSTVECPDMDSFTQFLAESAQDRCRRLRNVEPGKIANATPVSAGPGR